ncbi:MAG: hypothetical protein HYV09_05805 [Deltaproteobacteria bacterium]|nr:hypothetical protein [Deltaproteobacteria bacterium]
MKARLLALVLLTLAPRSAFADDAAAAQVLFEEGRALAQAGKCEEAIPKFAASHRLDPAPGPLLNLADCLEKTGRTASAWARFVEAAGLLKGLGQPEREAWARKRAAALFPKLARLTLVAKDPPPGLTLVRDGVTLETAALGVALPVDPGAHVIEARAPGKKPVRVELRVEPEQSTTFTVPALVDDDSPKPVAAEPPRPQRTVGIVTTATGVVALGVGATFGLIARSRFSELESRCPGRVCDSPTDLARVDDVKSAARLSDWFFAGGAVLLTTGVVIWLTAPSSATAPNVGLTVVPGGGALVGQF